MQQQLKAIDRLIHQHEIKKAEVLTAKHLRLSQSPEDRSQFLMRRARIRLLSDRPDDALSDLETILKLDNHSINRNMLLEMQGDCYLTRFETSSVGFADRSDTVKAQNTYETIINNSPDYANIGWVHYQLGRIALTNNDVDRAETQIHRALLMPSHVPPLVAYCFERLGFIAFYEHRDLFRALGFLDKAAFTYPPHEPRAWLVQVHMLRSRVLRDMHQLNRAIGAAEKAVQIASNAGIEARMDLAEALMTVAELLSSVTGREQEIVSHIQQFLQISKKPLGVDVTWSRAHEMLGDACFALQQYAEAIDAFNTTLQYNPYHPWSISLYYRIARSYYQMRDYARAIETIHQMQSAASSEGETIDDYRVYDVLGNAQFALGNYAAAADAYQIALDLAPANAENVAKIRTYYQYTQNLMA